MLRPITSDRLVLRQRPLDRRPVMFQKWRDLLFLHWEYDARAIQRTLPTGLYVDTFEGSAYLGIVPFFMRDVRPWFAPTVPGISDFLELNLRTYVHDALGIPGVWFYSLDASQWLAVRLARTLFNLPYYHADMRAEKREHSGEISFRCQRRDSDPSLCSHFRYRAAGPVRYARPESLDFFLIERYLLFSHTPKRRLFYTGRVAHAPYPLVEAVVREWDDHIFRLDGLEPPGRPPDHVLISPGVDVEIFALQKSGE